MPKLLYGLNCDTATKRPYMAKTGMQEQRRKREERGMRVSSLHWLQAL